MLLMGQMKKARGVEVQGLHIALGLSVIDVIRKKPVERSASEMNFLLGVVFKLLK